MNQYDSEGRKHGYWAEKLEKSYYTFTTIVYTYNYFHGDLEGESTISKSSGFLTIRNFHKNKYHGPYKVIENNKKVIVRGMFNMGKRTGLWEYERGQTEFF